MPASWAPLRLLRCTRGPLMHPRAPSDRSAASVFLPEHDLGTDKLAASPCAADDRNISSHHEPDACRGAPRLTSVETLPMQTDPMPDAAAPHVPPPRPALDGSGKRRRAGARRPRRRARTFPLSVSISVSLSLPIYASLSLSLAVSVPIFVYVCVCLSLCGTLSPSLSPSLPPSSSLPYRPSFVRADVAYPAPLARGVRKL